MSNPIVPHLQTKLEVFEMSQEDKRLYSLARSMALGNIIAIDIPTGIRMQGGYRDTRGGDLYYSIVARNGIDTLHRFTAPDDRAAIAYSEKWLTLNMVADVASPYVQNTPVSAGCDNVRG